MTASDIAHELTSKPRRNRAGYLVPCVCHSDSDPSLSIRDGENGRVLLKCFGGCSFQQVRDALRDLGLWDCSAPSSRPVSPPEPVKDLADYLDELWGGASPIHGGDPVGLYLRNRNIDLDTWPEVLKFHPRLKYREEGEPVTYWPGMLALIQSPTGTPVGIHRTYLTDDGRKAPVPSPKKMLAVKPGTIQGGAVRLFPPKDGVLGITEGIETALSAYLLTETPTWSCLMAGGIERVALPGEIRRVTIFADHDRNNAGLKSALRAYDRLTAEGRKVEIRQPKEFGDYNDVLKKEARQGVTA